MAAGWNLSSGELTRFHVDLDRYWAYFNFVFSDACSKRSTYKFGLIKAIVDCLYSTEYTQRGMELTYEKIFSKFTENYWNLIAKYNICQIIPNGRYNTTRIEQYIYAVRDRQHALKVLDYECLCECQYLIAEYELEFGSSASEENPEKKRRLKRTAADRGIAAIRSMEQLFQSSSYRYYSGEQRELDLISRLLLRYRDVICDAEKEELNQIEKNAKERKKADRKRNYGSNPLVWLAFYVFLWLMPFSIVTRSIIAVFFVILACLIQYKVNYSVLKSAIIDKKYLSKATREALMAHFIMLFAFGGFGFVVYWFIHYYPDMFSISITDLLNLDPLMVFLLLLFIVPLFIMGFVTDLWPSWGLFRIWRKIRKWPDTLPQFK